MSTLKAFLNTFFPASPTYLPKDYPDLTNKTVFITGTSAGVGKEISRLLLEQNATIVVANRNKTKTEKSIKEIKDDIIKAGKLTKEQIDKSVIQLELDLSDLSTIKPAIEQLKTKGVEKLDIVILNAGVMQPPNGSTTKQGWELQYGTNVLGHQLLLALLQPFINESKASNFTPRVVFLSSASSFLAPKDGGLNWKFKDASNANSQLIYGQSKAANYYQASVYGHDHQDTISIAVHPGGLKSELQRNYRGVEAFIVGKLLHPPVYGAYSVLFAALNQNISVADSGKYVGPWGVFRDVRADLLLGTKDGTARKMWNYNEEQIEKFK